MSTTTTGKFASLPTPDTYNNDESSDISQHNSLVLFNNNNSSNINKDNEINKSYEDLNYNNGQKVIRKTNKVVTTTQQFVTQRRIQKVVSSSSIESGEQINTSTNPALTMSNDKPASTDLVPVQREIIPTQPKESVEEFTTVKNSEDGSVVKTTTKKVKKTIARKVVTKKHYKNGVLVEEQIVESGPSDMVGGGSGGGNYAIEGGSSPPGVGDNFIADGAGEGVVARNNYPNGGNAGIPSGGINFQAVAAFKTVSETGEEQSTQISSGPMQAQLVHSKDSATTLSIRSASNQGPLSIEGGDSSDPSLALMQNSGSGVQEVLPDGTIVTRKFFGTKTATVTHSSCINGETKTSSKSAFMSFKAETMSDAQSSIEGMEQVFQGMMSTMKGNPFCVLDEFVKLKDDSFMDQLALACGSDFLAVEKPTEASSTGPMSKLNKIFHMKKALPPAQESTGKQKPNPPPQQPEILTTTTSNEAAKLAEMSRLPTEEQQQDMIRRKLEEIQGQESDKRNHLNWHGMEEVRNSGILENMDKTQIFLQEAMFEIITTEACYNITLDMLIDNYYKSSVLDPTSSDSPINHIEKNQLFSNVLLVKAVSFKFLKDLEASWSTQKPVLKDISDVILKHVEDEEFRQQYVRYTANVAYQQQVLEELLQKDRFKHALQNIEKNAKKCRVSFLSLLSAPGFRLMRIKLLLSVLLKMIMEDKSLRETLPENIIEKYNRAATIVDELVRLCENTKQKLDQKKRIIDLCKQLESSGICKSVSLAGEELLIEGEVKTHNIQLSATLIKKFSKKKQPTIYLIVCSNIVIIAKKKSPGTKLLVMDHCPRSQVKAECFSNSQSQHGVCCTLPSAQCETNDESEQRHHHHHSTASSTGPLSTSNSHHNASSNTSSSPANSSFPFRITFETTQSNLMTDSLVLAAHSKATRDEWIQAIMSN